MSGQLSLNLGLDVLPTTKTQDVYPDIFKLYNAVKLIADALDNYTGELIPEVPAGSNMSAFGVNYLRLQKIARVYLQASVAISAGNMVSINGTSKIALGAAGTVVGFAPAAIANGAYGEIQLLGLCTALSGLTPGAMYYAAASGGISTTVSAQKIGFAISSTLLFVNPA